MCSVQTVMHTAWRPVSCGNRHCPKCQNHTTSKWIDAQQQKLLPVQYFMATFTLPHELRSLAWRNQKIVYSLLFSCIASILKDFGMNPKHLGAEIGMTMVLHTNTRRLDYHPHVHVVIPGGGIDRQHRYWKKLKGTFWQHWQQAALYFLKKSPGNGFALCEGRTGGWRLSSICRGTSTAG